MSSFPAKPNAILNIAGFGVNLQDCVDYLKQRGCDYKEALEYLGAEFLTHAAADARVIIGEKENGSFYPKRSALWLPTKCLDGTSHPRHGQVIYFNPGRKPFKRHTPTTDAYPNEVNYLFKLEDLNENPTIYWCESTLKANILRKLGHFAVGMNGVNGWSRGGERGKLVQSAGDLPKDAIHVLITDSLNDKNKKSHTSVSRARRMWRHALQRVNLEATVRYIEMPKPPEGWPKADWGLDDYFITKGQAETEKLLSTAKEFRDNDELKVLIDDCNHTHCYIKSLSKTYDKDGKILLTKQQLFDNYASLNTSNGDPVLPAWFRSADRCEYSSLAFRPGEPEVVDNCLNLGADCGRDLEPVQNDIAVQKYWVDTLYDAYGSEARYVIELFAVLVQQPGRRVPRFLFINGKPGSGKGFTVAPLERIFESHTQPWSVPTFINNFNAAHRHCRLGIINEPGDIHSHAPSVRTALAEALKKNADPNERFMQLEPKGVDISKTDRLQFNVVISNYGPPFVIQTDDRRMVALQARQHMLVAKPGENLGTKTLEYWAERWNWLTYENGAAEVLYYLQNYNISGVDFDGPAPMTDYKGALLNQDQDSVQAFTERLNVNPVGVIRAVFREDKELPSPLVFDAGLIALLFGILVRPVDNHQAFTTRVGQLSQSVWECQSTPVVARRQGRTNARLFLIKDNKICNLNKDSLGLTGGQLLDAADKLVDLIARELK